MDQRNRRIPAVMSGLLLAAAGCYDEPVSRETYAPMYEPTAPPARVYEQSPPRPDPFVRIDGEDDDARLEPGVLGPPAPDDGRFDAQDPAPAVGYVDPTPAPVYVEPAPPPVVVHEHHVTENNVTIVRPPAYYGPRYGGGGGYSRDRYHRGGYYDRNPSHPIRDRDDHRDRDGHRDRDDHRDGDRNRGNDGNRDGDRNRGNDGNRGGSDRDRVDRTPAKPEPTRPQATPTRPDGGSRNRDDNNGANKPDRPKPSADSDRPKRDDNRGESRGESSRSDRSSDDNDGGRSASRGAKPTPGDPPARKR